MKYNILQIIIVGLGFILLNISCEHDLNSQPYDKIGEDVIWSTKANAETFIYSTYSIMNSFAGGPSTDPRTTNTLGFDGIYSGASGIFNETTDRYADHGFNNWGAIRRCNIIIERVTESPGISDADKVSLIAEAKFLRAMSYFNIARSTGRIVWIDKVLTPEDDLLLPSTANPKESYDYIIKDLEDAIADLPVEKIDGRANKYVAAALFTEVALQALAYKDYPNEASISTDDPLLEKVITYSKMVIDAGYSLEADYGGMFNEAKPNSPEIIFGIYRDAINTNCDGTPMQLMVPNMSNDQISKGDGSPLLKSPIRIFEAWVQHGPTQNIADDYLVIDDNNPNLAKPWYQTSQYINAIEENVIIPENKIPVANGEDIVRSGKIKDASNESIWTLSNRNRDARWAQSIISDSTEFYGETLTTGIQGNATRWLKMNGHAYYMSLTNMYWRKGVYNDVNPRVYVGIPTNYHYVVTRLGRVYLNLSEAYLLKNEVKNAVEAFNQTRTIHGQLPASTASSLENAWTDYKRERRIDLVLENDYYWSLLRWGRYGGEANHGIKSGGTIPELTETPIIMDISKDRKYYSIVSGAFYSANNERKFDETRRYLFPIAQSYIDRNPNFGPQNKGW